MVNTALLGAGSDSAGSAASSPCDRRSSTMTSAHGHRANLVFIGDRRRVGVNGSHPGRLTASNSGSRVIPRWAAGRHRVRSARCPMDPAERRILPRPRGRRAKSPGRRSRRRRCGGTRGRTERPPGRGGDQGAPDSPATKFTHDPDPGQLTGPLCGVATVKLRRRRWGGGTARLDRGRRPARSSGRRGRGFKSRHPDKKPQVTGLHR